MIHRFLCLAFGTLLSLLTVAPLSAQDSGAEADGASRQAEESDEAFRRRMELEDARQRDLGYKLPDETYVQKQEKLDKLPEESRENIRDQLVDIIVENGDWEPSDALKEYPYEPTVSAQADPGLMAQEQEAWDEQIEKYHRREAAAFGTYLGPVAGPGNPDGGPGGETGGGQGGSSDESAARDSERGGGQQAGRDGGESAGDGDAAAGTYEPYRSQHGQSEEAVSTAGVQQSALEFLKGSQNQEPAPSGSAPAADTAQAAAAQTTSPASAETDPAGAESAAESATTPDDTSQRVVDIDLSTPGIIAIEDLDKLEGADSPTIPPEPEPEPEQP
jgi:hypothetical protein